MIYAFWAAAIFVGYSILAAIGAAAGALPKEEGGSHTSPGYSIDGVGWCQQCGRWLPLQHDIDPNPRRRLVGPLLRLVSLLHSKKHQVLNWADKPYRRRA